MKDKTNIKTSFLEPYSRLISKFLSCEEKKEKVDDCANSLKKATTLFNCNNGSASKGWRTIQSGGPLFDVALQATTLFYDHYSDG